MSKSIKFKNDTYLDSSGVTFEKIPLDKILTFSFVEQIIGKWVDGKNLYRKTIKFNPTIAGEQVACETGVTNVNLMWVDKSNSFLIRESGSVMCGIGNDGNDGYWFDIRQVKSDFSNVYCKIGESIYSNSTVFITILYTKTTD